jgi:uncharacterized protein (DUF1697 family)
MPGYAAFLRGINVAGRRATKEQLGACFEGLGYGDVGTFRASGNVLFSAGRQSTAAMSARIEEELERALGYQVTVFLRSDAEMAAIAALQPFETAVVKASEGKLQTMLLSAPAAAAVRKDVLGMATAQDRLAFGERELYWLPSGNMRDSALRLRKVEALVGSYTMRTKGTLDEIAARYFAD